MLRHGNPGGPTSFDTRLALQSYGRTGEWQTLEIQAIGDAIHVTLNDNYLGTASAGGNARGYIGLQAETGSIEFRSIEINEGVKGLVTGRSSEGFVPLFDGKTLNGWKPQNASRQVSMSWTAPLSSGADLPPLRPAAAPTGPTCSGNIWTERSYRDFVLRYQARFQTNGSVGGFFLRSHPPEAAGNAGRLESGRNARDGGQAAAVERNPDAGRRR